MSWNPGQERQRLGQNQVERKRRWSGWQGSHEDEENRKAVQAKSRGGDKMRNSGRWAGSAV